MRLLTALSGMFLSAVGAFCFAFYANRFADVAFLVGLTMMVSGGLQTAAYLVSGRGENRTTDTTLVEGLVTFFYGFAVISNQVSDSGLTMFFGTWLTLCGITRFAQSIYVSRFNPKDWSKILPLAVIASMVGIIMMLPWLVSSVMPLMLVGGAMLLNGLSVIMYAMYMKKESKESMAKGEAEALARAEAKKAEHIAARKEQERLRSLSKEEREKEEQERRSKELQAEQERRAKRAAEKAARRDSGRSMSGEATLRLEDDEVAAINAAAEQLNKAPVKVAKEIKSIDDIASVRAAVREEVAKPEVKKEEPQVVSSKPVWNKPAAIPSLRAENKLAEKKSNVEDVKLSAVKLDEIENSIPILNFDKIELPKVEYASDYGLADRNKVIEKINNIKTDKVESVQYPSIDLEELVAEPLANKTDPSDATRFTQKIDFTWIEKINEEIKKKEKL